MLVMVMNDDPAVQVRIAKGLMARGFQVVGMETVSRACAYVKADPVDLLILGERISGRLSHTVALAAECANPMVTTMILTDRRDAEIEELYDLLPSLYALVGPGNDASVVAALALSALANPEAAEARMRRNAAAVEVRRDLAEQVEREAGPSPSVDAEASFFEDDAAEVETVSWGSEEAACALADAATASATPTSGSRFADVIQALSPEADPAADQSERRVGAVAPGVSAAAPPEAALSATPVPVAVGPDALRGPDGTPLPPTLAARPEAMPPRPDGTARAAWIAAKVQELEAASPRSTQRMHLA